jgi:hypothetical protein
MVLLLLVSLLFLADRSQRRHDGTMDPGEAGRDKGLPFG